MWIPPEDKDPIYYHCPTRRSVGYFGAVRLRDGKFVYKRSEGRFNGDSFLDFLKFLRRVSTRSGKTVVVIVDNAPYHDVKTNRHWLEKQGKNFCLDFLPPYSPKLSMVERVWKLTRRLRTHNDYFPGLEQLMDAVETQFEVWRDPNETLRKLCAIT